MRPLAVLFVFLAASPCWAVGEEERQVAVAAGPGWLLGDGAAAGAGGRIEAQYGVSDVLAVHAGLGASWHDRRGGTVRALALVAGVTYALDVLRVVPFLEAGVAFLDQGAAAGRRDLGVEGGLGGEYLIDRRWAVALVARGTYLPLRLGGGGGGRRGVVGVALRLGRRF
jgi:hypothetical protein